MGSTGSLFGFLREALPWLAPRRWAGRVSAIVTTYNRSGFLRLCIASLEKQTRPPDEVVIADDGSDAEHVRAIGELVQQSPLKIVHAWQEHRGFRIAANRNNAVRHSSGDLLFFTDGDMVLFPDVLERHMAASEGRYWASSHNGVRLTAEESERVTEEAIRSGRLEEVWPGWEDPRAKWLRREAERFRHKARRLWRQRLVERRCRRFLLITGQASVPRAAFERVNGFDEAFEGWGDEDIDLGLRLQLSGVRGQTVADASRVFHLYHDPAPLAQPNRDYYRRPRHGQWCCEKGLRQEGTE